MDAQKSLKIAARRFQNGNYLLSLKKYGQARKEFEVALTLYEKTDSYKETAETLNNIGITLLKDGMADVAKGYFERSYALKKGPSIATGESVFNTLYNLMSVSGVLGPDEFERYFLEMKALGESLGGDFLSIVEGEQAVYEGMKAQRAVETRRKEEEEVARSSPAGALENLVASGMPCVVRAEFALHGFKINLGEPITFLDQRKVIKIERLTGSDGPAGAISTGLAEFEAPYDSVRWLVERLSTAASTAQAGPLWDETFEHVRKLMGALALVREDINYSLTRKGFTITSVQIKNSFGELMEIFKAAVAPSAEPVVLSTEDVMLVNVMLSSEPAFYKQMLLNARRLLDEENYPLALVDAVTGLDAFLNVLLRGSLTGDHLLDYTSIEDCSLYDRLLFLKRMLTDSKVIQERSLGPCLGDAGREMDEVINYYDQIMAGDRSGIGAAEASKALKTVNHAVYDLKSKYGV